MELEDAFIIFFILVLLWAAAALAPQAKGDSAQPIIWNAETHLRLSQCFIAEADESVGDWTAVAFTMRNWLESRRKRYPELRYLDIVRTTCSVHKLSDSSRSRRQRWIRALDFPGPDGAGARPKGFPRNASWKRKQRYWLKALHHAQRWRDGELRDPCGGRAVIWGAPRDKDNPWHLPSDDPLARGLEVVRLPCSDKLANDYYRPMTRREKAQAEAGS